MKKIILDDKFGIKDDDFADFLLELGLRRFTAEDFEAYEIDKELREKGIIPKSIKCRC